MVVCFGLPVFFEGAVYNAAAVACDGRLLGLVAKQHLAGDGIHYEPRWFRRWPAGVVGDDRNRRQRRIRSATCCSTAAACGSALKSAATPGSPTAPAPGWPSAGPTSCSIPAPAISRSPSSRFASGSCWKARGRFA